MANLLSGSRDGQKKGEWQRMEKYYQFLPSVARLPLTKLMLSNAVTIILKRP
jgi:hypothetical protein